MLLRTTTLVLALATGGLSAQQQAGSAAPIGVTLEVATRYLAIAESASTSPQVRAAWQQRLDRLRDTIESVLRWNNTHERTSASLRMLQAVGPFWNGAALVSAFDEALSAPTSEDSLLRARALNSASLAAFRINDQAHTRAWARQSIALFLALRDSAGAGRSYQRLVQAALRDANHSALRMLADTGQKLCERDPNCDAYFINMRGESARVQQQYDSAAIYYGRADSIYRRLSPVPSLGMAHNLGFTLLALGRSAEARTRFAEGLQNASAANNRPYVAFFVAGFASADAVDHNAKDAARLFGLFDTLLAQTGRIPDPADAVEYDRYRARSVAELGTTTFNDFLRAGRMMSIDSLVAAHRK